MTTIHMIASAHIDPVWLWRWQNGVVEVISTCRTAAGLLDSYPEARFTRSDQWVYEQIESTDPALFERIRRHVAEGRWSVAGGWYIQPDCNFPHAESFRRHMRFGRAWFRDRFGFDVNVGYNVDSFGHHAMLPSLLAENGYDSYVMMRPMPHEKTLPCDLFRWRSPDGAEVLCWRIATGYVYAGISGLDAHAARCLATAHPSVPHVMCFYGLGDHGGGPSRAQIEWIRDHPDAVPGARLVFSTPRAFFDAVAPYRESLPVVQEELQYHAIGCYSVVREIKSTVRRAEHSLLRAERCAVMHPRDTPPVARGVIDSAWKEVLYNQFHDILAGTSLEVSYQDARDQLGLAAAAAETLTAGTLVRSLTHLPPDPRQRVALWNLSDQPFDGPLAHDPWLEGRSFAGRLVDQQGREVPYQVCQQPALLGSPRLLVWMDRMEPLSSHRLFLEPATPPAPVSTDLALDGPGLRSATARLGPSPEDDVLFRLEHEGGCVIAPRLVVQEDTSDTWSHGIDRYAGPVVGHFRVHRRVVEESGPVRATLRVDATHGGSRLCLRVRLYRGRPYVDLELELGWMERAKIAKLVVPTTETAGRRDGIPGGSVERASNGREVPMMDWTHLPQGWGVASPDCYALDGSPRELRFTLVRSPVYAWHEPTILAHDASHRHTDQGEHVIRFRWMPDATPAALAAAATSFHSSPSCLDWTWGMGDRH